MMEELFKELSVLSQVEAIAVGGSRADSGFDDKSDYDVIFAYNELTYPGEKRLLALCEKQCHKLPVNFRRNQS